MSLADKITYFLAKHRMEEEAFGWRVANNRDLVSGMRQGRMPDAEATYRIERFLEDYQPPRATPPATTGPRFQHEAPAPGLDSITINDTARRSAAAAGSQTLLNRILGLYAKVARRDGISIAEAAILLNHGPQGLATWRARP